MSSDARTPVLVGCGQLKQRVEDPREGIEPIALMMEALRRAADDCGAPEILSEASSIRVPRGLWKYANPAALLRDQLFAMEAETATSIISGNMVQFMLTDAAREIAAGTKEIVLLVGGEAEHSARRAKAQGLDLGWTQQKDSTPDRSFGSEERAFIRAEIEAGLTQPALIFALFENALRAERGETIDAHRERISELWARMSTVAEGNPFAWSTVARSAREIRTPTAENPMHAFPYTKFMCSNMVVDQAAAVILCSVAAAKRYGIPPERWVYLHAATDAQKSSALSYRRNFHSTPLIGRAGTRAFELAETSPEEIDYLDLYSCFPAAVQLGIAELGLPENCTPTVTGGLGFAGGPFNSYVLHSIATMMNRLREDRNAKGLISSIGGWVSKHGIGIYSATPPEHGFRYADLDPELGDVEHRQLDADYAGPATVETYAVRYRSGEPFAATIACLNDDGARTWAKTEDSTLLEGMLREELIGRSVRVRGDRTLDVS